MRIPANDCQPVQTPLPCPCTPACPLSPFLPSLV
uniref:Uncharacterized protein n=1 Tax=Anguilla anguilla TaxID=7936 RepID=A0A0E9TQU2_ANGAN